MSSTLVNSLAKVYDPNPLHGQKLSARKFSLNGSDRSQASSSSSHHDASLRCMESRIDSLSSQMEHLLNMQQIVLTRLDGLSQDVRGMVRDMASSNEERRGSGIEAICRELHGAVERIESQGCRLEGVEKLVEGTQQVISFIGEVVKSSKLVELLFKQPGNKTSRKVMNQLNHANLIQLYAAFESRNDIILVMEYVEGGELFDRIIDENYNLTELDTVLFIRQISEGLQYMHKNYILHLDLKTLNNILACQWNFEEEEFGDISDEAKDFITRLLVKSKSWRMSATESLRHAWLSDRNLHYRLHQKVQKVSYLKAIVSSSIKHGGVCAWELISFVKL
ncbi:hypothetical protein XENOCAPTIV_004730 [Xenoophorus captivus]|uniref:Protein kinase domain-containing protein n=1 Tax=Xenoophorus captivus TaxID=1517983 RepID=A0ABV0RK30_9TELE